MPVFYPSMWMVGWRGALVRFVPDLRTWPQGRQRKTTPVQIQEVPERLWEVFTAL